MAKVLVQWADNWADEMDLEGFVIMEEGEWKEYKENLKQIDKPFTICIGSNEDIKYENGENLLAVISHKKLTSEEYKTISKHFGESGGFEQFSYADQHIEGELDELEDETYFETEEEDF